MKQKVAEKEDDDVMRQINKSHKGTRDKVTKCFNSSLIKVVEKEEKGRKR